MPKSIEYHRNAKSEFDESVAWYAERNEQTAERFIVDVESANQRISEHPTRFPLTSMQCRICLLEKFPYSIIFRETAQSITLIAIAHAKRRPYYWNNRLT